MSAPNRYPLDSEKLQALSKEEAISLIEVLSKNLKYSPTAECLEQLVPLVCAPDPKSAVADTKLTNSGAQEKKKKNKKKVFDIANYRQRHIALHVYYDGAKYLGE